MLSPIPNPKHVAIGFVCGAAISAAVTLTATRWRADSVELQAVRTEVREVGKETTRKRAIATKFEESRHASDTYFEQQRDAYQAWLRDQPAISCELDAAGLQLWNAANRGAANAYASESGPAVRYDATDAGERPAAGLAAQSHHSGGAISPDVRSAQRPD